MFRYSTSLGQNKNEGDFFQKSPSSSLPTLLDFSLLALPSSPFRRGRARPPWPRTLLRDTKEVARHKSIFQSKKKRRLMPSFLLLVGVTRLELATSWSRTKRTTKLCHTPISIKLHFHANVILTHREAFVNRDEGIFVLRTAFFPFLSLAR